MHAHVAEGRQRISGAAHYTHHRHALAYAAVVLRGAYEEAGERGRHRARAGDVILHEPFDAHCDRFTEDGCEILNLHLPAGFVAPFVFGRTADLDGVVRRANRDPREAAAHLLDTFEPVHAAPAGWPDRLVADMWRSSRFRLGAWADGHGLAHETVSRNFARIWGVSPARFRASVRARKAWRMIVASDRPLAFVAAEAGFADQAHMTRGVTALTGRSPGAWRRSNPFKTAAHAPV